MKKKQDLKLLQIINKVKSTIIEYNMIDEGDKIVVGVSGGPDSICLLHILYELKDEFKYQLITAHFDHGMRPGEDERETRFVKGFSEKLGIPFEYKKTDEDIKSSGSIEEKARILRYNFLEEVREKYGAERIAVGHNMNDQAETVLMRLIRGSGTSGLRGIPPVRGRIIRPIIKLTREEVLYYLKKRGLSYMIDSSNMSLEFLRNRIRHELIPYLLKYQPNIIEILANTAEILFLENDFLEKNANDWIKRNVKEIGEISVLKLEDLKAVHPALKNRILRNILEEKIGSLKRISHKHISSILKIAFSEKANAEVHIPYGIKVEKSYDRLFIKRKEDVQDFCYIINDYGRYYIREIKSWIILEKSDDALDVSFPIVVRNMRKGDRISVNGHKKVKDIFIDLKIPKGLRKKLPMIVKDGKPVYICGIERVDKRYKTGVKNGIKIRFETEEPLLKEYLQGGSENALR